jgi:hypothetical protein
MTSADKPPNATLLERPVEAGGWMVCRLILSRSSRMELALGRALASRE